MSQPPNIDGVLIQWGDRCSIRETASSEPSRPDSAPLAARQRAAAIRERIEAPSAARRR